MRPLKNYPNLLKDLNKLEDSFPLELIGLENHAPIKTKSMLLSLMPLEGTCNNTEEKEKNPQMMMILMKSLLMISLITQISKPMSPSHKYTTSKQWDLFPKSSMGTEPKLTPSSPNS
jgi:hypothetical protein